MIDFIKLRTKVADNDGFIQNCKITLSAEVSTADGEIAGPWKGECRNMKLKLYDSGLLFVAGSIHKFHNDGKQNYSDFGWNAYVTSVNELSELVGLSLWDATLETLEVGVNVVSLIDVSSFLRNIFRHKFKPVKDLAVSKNGEYKQAEYSNYIVKIYNKGKQFNLETELLRFEVKLMADELRRLLIGKLSDTLSHPNIIMFQEILAQRFDELLLFDPTIKKHSLTHRQLHKLKDWGNPLYWAGLRTPGAPKNAYNEEIKQIRRIIENHSDHIQLQTRKLIVQKSKDLIDLSEEEAFHKVGKIRIQLNGAEESTTGIIGTSIIGQHYTDIRYCKITGLPISMQKDDSRFLSKTGVKYYREDHPRVYTKLRKRLSPKWDDVSNDVRDEEIAHSIRNEYHHKKNSLIHQLNKTEHMVPLFSEVALLCSKLSAYDEVINILNTGKEGGMPMGR